ncbi:MAG: ectoine synthase [Actinomycetota bacterium]
MIVRSVNEITGTDRDVDAPTFVSRRLLLAKDGMGFSLHDTLLYAGTETEIHYQNHLEAVYCLEGMAEIVELEGDGRVHKIEPGMMYALDQHDRHLLRAITDFRAVCVFNPPLTGREVHDENGVYPLIVEEEEGE